MTGIVNSTGAKSGIIGTIVGTPPGGKTVAWANWDGGGSDFRASFNCSTIADGGVGRWTFNFTTARPNANYAVTLGTNGHADAAEWGDRHEVVFEDFATTNFKIVIYNAGYHDTGLICAQVTDND